MILPIIAYGDPVLRKLGKSIDKDYPALESLLDNMFETMYGAKGIGLAAPQIGLPIRIFIVDATPFKDDEELELVERNFLSTFKQVFINAQIIDETGDEWLFNEGCLSIPDVREDVFRNETVKIEYLDEKFEKHTKEFSGIAARIIQHEYDHVEGVLFTDKLSSFKKRLINKKLQKISSGKVNPDYKMHFYKSPKKNN